MATKIISEATLQTLLQLIAVEIKKKADSGHIHNNYVTTEAFNSAIGSINSFDAQVVNSMEELEAIKTNGTANTHTIYFVKDNNDTNNLHHEYMYVNGTFEKIGDTSIDLSEYATIDYTDGAIANAIADSIGDFSDLNPKFDGTYTSVVDVFNDVLNKIAEINHTHTISDVTGLQDALNNKSNVGHKHTKSDITDYTDYELPTASATQLGGVKVGAGLAINNGVLSATGGGTADSVDWENVQNRPTKLSEFTNDTKFVSEGHKHEISDVNGLQTALDNKSDDGHGHAISDVTGLQNALNNKSDTGHNHDGTYIKTTDIEYITESEATTMWTTAMNKE